MRKTMLKLAAGAVGSLVATWLMQKSMPLSKKLPEKLQPPMPNQDPGEFMVDQGEKIVGPVSPKLHSTAAHGLHWAYGLVWPVGLAALADALDLDSTKKTIAAGAILGALVWAVGYVGWLPATGLTPPVHRIPAAK